MFNGSSHRFIVSSLHHSRCPALDTRMFLNASFSFGTIDNKKCNNYLFLSVLKTIKLNEYPDAATDYWNWKKIITKNAPTEKSRDFCLTLMREEILDLKSSLKSRVKTLGFWQLWMLTSFYSSVLLGTSSFVNWLHIARKRFFYDVKAAYVKSSVTLDINSRPIYVFVSSGLIGLDSCGTLPLLCFDVNLPSLEILYICTYCTVLMARYEVNCSIKDTAKIDGE